MKTTQDRKTVNMHNILELSDEDIQSAFQKHIATLDAYRNEHGKELCPVSYQEKRARKAQHPLEVRRFLWTVIRNAMNQSKEPLHLDI